MSSWLSVWGFDYIGTETPVPETKVLFPVVSSELKVVKGTVSGPLKLTDVGRTVRGSHIVGKPLLS